MARDPGMRGGGDSRADQRRVPDTNQVERERGETRDGGDEPTEREEADEFVTEAELEAREARVERDED